MLTKYIECHANLNKFPTVCSDLSRVVIGDIHGNSQYLLYLLIKFGVVKLNADQYKQLSKIYNVKTKNLTATQLNTFRKILKKSKYNPNVSLLFLGDTLSDRGNNDYFTLCIFRRLASHKVPFTILLANHDYEFLSCYEQLQRTGKANFVSKNIKPSQSSSMSNLNRLLKLKLADKKGEEVITVEHLKRWIPSYLLEHYKALDYCIEDEKIIIYSHAPIDVDIIMGIAGELDVKHEDDNPEVLAASIDNINQKVTQLLTDNHLCDKFTGMYSNKRLSSKHVDPLTRLIWNRDYDSLEHSRTHKGYKVCFVHGHDATGKPLENVTSLDKLFGKTSKHTKGNLHYLGQMRPALSFFPKSEENKSNALIKNQPKRLMNGG